MHTDAHSYSLPYTHAYLHKLRPTTHTSTHTYAFSHAHTLSHTRTQPMHTCGHSCTLSLAHTWSGPRDAAAMRITGIELFFPYTRSYNKENRKGLGARDRKRAWPVRRKLAPAGWTPGLCGRDSGQTDRRGRWEVECPPRRLGPGAHPHHGPRRCHPLPPRFQMRN